MMSEHSKNLQNFVSDGKRCVLHRKAKTLMPKDIKLELTLRGDSQHFWKGSV